MTNGLGGFDGQINMNGGSGGREHGGMDGAPPFNMENKGAKRAQECATSAEQGQGQQGGGMGGSDGGGGVGGAGQGGGEQSAITKAFAAGLALGMAIGGGGGGAGEAGGGADGMGQTEGLNNIAANMMGGTKFQ